MALDRAAALLESVLEDRAGSVGDVSGFGPGRAQDAAEDVRGLLHAGARALERELASATTTLRTASAQWRTRDALLGGRR